MSTYSNRTLVGNWLDSITMHMYQMKKLKDDIDSGNLLLSRKRAMAANLDTPVEVTKLAAGVPFGSLVNFLSPYIETSLGKGVYLGGRIDAREIARTQTLVEDCKLCGLSLLQTSNRNIFVIKSADYCNREGEFLKYNQEFLMVVLSSFKNKPLYVRYDQPACPGVSDNWPLYLSHNPVSNSRWRLLPTLKPNITRLELEGQNVPINEDIIINHCSSNLNLSLNPAKWALGFHGNVCLPEMKTSLDVYGRELPHNIWQIYVPEK